MWREIRKAGEACVRVVLNKPRLMEVIHSPASSASKSLCARLTRRRSLRIIHSSSPSWSSLSPYLLVYIGAHCRSAQHELNTYYHSLAYNYLFLCMHPPSCLVSSLAEYSVSGSGLPGTITSHTTGSLPSDCCNAQNGFFANSKNDDPMLPYNGFFKAPPGSAPSCQSDVEISPA